MAKNSGWTRLKGTKLNMGKLLINEWLPYSTHHFRLHAKMENSSVVCHFDKCCFTFLRTNESRKKCRAYKGTYVKVIVIIIHPSIGWLAFFLLLFWFKLHLDIRSWSLKIKRNKSSFRPANDQPMIIMEKIRKNYEQKAAQQH